MFDMDKLSDESMGFNMDKPIFVSYINVDGHGRSRVDEKVHQLGNHYSLYGMQCIVMPVTGGQETKVDILWKGDSVEKSRISDGDDLETIKETLNFILDLIERGISDETLKSRLRDLQLGKILNDGDK